MIRLADPCGVFLHKRRKKLDKLDYANMLPKKIRFSAVFCFAVLKNVRNKRPRKGSFF